MSSNTNRDENLNYLAFVWADIKLYDCTFASLWKLRLKGVFVLYCRTLHIVAVLVKPCMSKFTVFYRAMEKHCTFEMIEKHVVNVDKHF